MPYPDVGDRRCPVNVESKPFAGGMALHFAPRSCDEKVNRTTLFVLGDSHATMLAPIFEQLSAEFGVDVGIYSYFGCPFINFIRPMASMSPDPGCLTFNRAVSNHVVTNAKPGDIVVLSSLRLARYGSAWATNEDLDIYDFMYNPTALKQREAAFLDSAQWLESFAEKQLKVVFVSPMPIFKAPPFRCSDWFNSTNPICIGQNQQSRAELDALRTPVVKSMEALSREFSNVQILDVFPILCPEETCYVFKAGRPQFFDGDHLSAYGNFLLYPEFRRTFNNISHLSSSDEVGLNMGLNTLLQ